MKPPLARYLITALFCAIAGTTFADDFKSKVIAGGMPLDPTIRVHGDQFMVIRNFTQTTATGTMRGVVMVSAPPGFTPVNVLAAAILDKTPLEVINSVVIAGPADVTVTCPDATAVCFISYKKDSN